MAKRVLVLSGGGAKGIYEVALLRQLLRDEPDLDFDLFLGVSAGALNSAYLAQAPIGSGCGCSDSVAALRAQVDGLSDIWRQVEGTSQVYEGRAADPGLFTLIAVALFGKDSIADAGPIRRLIGQHISTERVRASGRSLHIGTTSLGSGSTRVFRESDADIPTAVKASAAVPGVFSPIEMGGDCLVDGAIRDNTPLGAAYGFRPTEEIVVIQTSPLAGWVPTHPWRSDEKNALDVLVRSAGIMADEVQVNDVDGALAWNRALRVLENVAAAAPDPWRGQAEAALGDLGKAYVRTRVYAPDSPLLQNELVFTKEDMDTMYLRGTADAAAPKIVV